MRRRKLPGAVAALTLAGAAAFVLWPRPDRLTRVNFDRLREGMSLAEVGALFGPPGDYRTGPTVISEDTTVYRGLRPGPWPASAPAEWAEWRSDGAWVEVGFDDAGSAIFAAFSPGWPTDQGALDNLLWRAKRQWRRWFP